MKEYSSLVVHCFSVLLLTSAQYLGSVYSWSDWSEPSACSRTCGGGVQFQERECLTFTDDGQSTCEGPNKIYTSCNIQDCAEDSIDFRAVQCQRYNNIPFDDKYYEWLPYFGGNSECELNCLAKGETFYYRQAAKVVDGTRCNRDTLDVCVDGICRPVGCDKKLGSGARFDRCRVCNGDDSTCRTVIGNLSTDHLSYGYSDLLLVPAAATSISIEEDSTSNNYLALRTQSGGYLLNGDWVIDLTKPRDVAGTRLEYSRDLRESGSIERLTAPGPTSGAFIVSILKQPGPSANILYEYSIPVHADGIAATEQYSWATGEWSACSRSCAHGQQSRDVTCTRSSDATVVSDNLCDPFEKPEAEQSCNTEPCEARWYVGVWQECTASCGTGLQVRTIFCEQALRGDFHSVVEPSACAEPMPPKTQECDSGSECPSWQAGPWSKCSRFCGPGQQTREVVCRSSSDPSLGEVLPHERCDWEQKPESSQGCELQSCEGAEWVTSEWSGCHGTCDQGFETRQVVCSSKTGHVFNDSLCDGAKKPSASRSCLEDRECPSGARWFASQWGPCSAHCGAGIASRTVVCAENYGSSHLRLVDASLCNADAKPAEQQPCRVADCTGLWFTGPWGKCSKPCDGGEREREVMCIAGGGVSDTTLCDRQHTPGAFESCNNDIPCNDEELIIDCKNTLYGCCPDQFTAAEGHDFFGCPSKDAIPVGFCVESDFGCCLDGVTAATGPFLAGCPPYTCLNTIWGCCWDRQTTADGPNGEGCPAQIPCAETYFGCCEDGLTAAQGFLGEGCTLSCEFTEFGCCPDGVNPAQGGLFEGCEIDGSGEPCEDTQYGCCFDGTPATGPDGEGCNEVHADCHESRFGCCPDGERRALGPALEGCSGVPGADSGCHLTAFGCCADGITPMLDDTGAGCHTDIIEVEDCENTIYGCCTDGTTIAQGPNKEGCPILVGGCAGTRHGCCPDGQTSAQGPNYLGCDDAIVIAGCETSVFGCCPDGATPAEGFNLEGCENVTQTVPECDTTVYGCCRDGQSVAAGPSFEGCGADATFRPSCTDSPYGCCPDGEAPARGLNDAGCPSRINRGAVCGLPKELGTCTNYTVMWYFDLSYGECSRFWYGGCDGNRNRFATRQECENHCKSPEGIDKCYLPKSIGRCSEFVKKYHYNPDVERCESFMYGGCKGNANQFDDEASCKKECVEPQVPEVCSQPQTPGPCRGQFVRWFYDKPSGMCRQFIYGGCQGNDNRFVSEEVCEQRCKEPATTLCKLEKDPGPCQADYKNWYFDTATEACETFTYGGCQGNANRFPTKVACEEACHELIPKKDVCGLPKEKGPCRAYYERWFFNKQTGFCEQFVYGGCQGNANQFETELECRQTCNATQRVDPCTLLNNIGTGNENLIKYFFDVNTGKCREFVYSGDGGNENRFDTLEECMKSCRDIQVTLPPDTSDRCTLEAESGPCTSNIERWFYDAHSAICREFVYGGCGGNRNRFQTQANCEQACGGSATAKPMATTQMPKDKGQDICSLPMETGNCLAHIPSWFYNVNTEQCEQFIYGGCNGNDNRFDTEEECLSQCQTDRTDTPGIGLCNLESDAGPCKADIEQWYYDTEKGRCLPFSWGGCGGNQNRFSSEERCQAACQPYDICNLEADVGPCKANKLRYAFNTLLGRCEQFYFGGCRGNANRFLSMETCQRVCASQMTSVDKAETCSAESDAGACDDYSIYWYYNAASQRCAQFYYGGCDGNRNRFQTRNECHDYCAPKTPAPSTGATPPSGGRGRAGACLEKSDAGDCTDYETLWYFDVAAQACRRFWYGGCGGNANRFTTQEECEQFCALVEDVTTAGAVTSRRQHVTAEVTEPPETEKPVTTPAPPSGNICLWRPEKGDCLDYEVRWYYNREHQRCRRFWYGGCRGNANNFASQEDCLLACQSVSGGEKNTVSGVISASKRCVLPPERGKCHGYTVRWYYNHGEQRCQRFWYGGCNGNENNFENEDDCLITCHPVSEEDDSFYVYDNDLAVTCRDLECRMACDYGFAVDENGCTVCECAHPCQAYACPAHHECVLDDVQCVTQPCLPVPVCVPTPKPGECPELPVGDPSLCLYECDDDHDCHGDAKCCDTGCGKICASPGQPGCASSVFGCCPDGKTTASGWEFKGCMEQEPVIEEHPLQVFVELGHSALLPCTASGVPSPVISWYKDRRPLVEDAELMSRSLQHGNGTLEIRGVVEADESMYSCRAYNSLGADTRTYTLTVQVAPTLKDPNPSTVTVHHGKALTLDCGVIGGIPEPTIEWHFTGRHGDVRKRLEAHDVTLVLDVVGQMDDGTYSCVVNNGVGRPLEKVIDVKVEVPLSVEIEPHSATYKTGQDLLLKCFSDPPYDDVIITWYKDSKELSYMDNSRILSLEKGRLEISKLHVEDSGVYECKIARGKDAMIRATSIEVTKSKTAGEIPEGCMDKPFYADCSLIVQASMCSHPYFSDFCCYSCRRAGLLKRR